MLNYAGEYCESCDACQAAVTAITGGDAALKFSRARLIGGLHWPIVRRSANVNAA